MTAEDDVRLELIELVERIRSGSIESEDAEDQAIAEFASRVPHPRPSDLIFHPHLVFSHAPSVEEIVDHALNYRPLELE